MGSATGAAIVGQAGHNPQAAASAVKPGLVDRRGRHHRPSWIGRPGERFLSQLRKPYR